MGWYSRAMKISSSRRRGTAAGYEIRRQAIDLREAGKTIREIVTATGLSSASVSAVWLQYLDSGIVALEPKIRGRRHGEGRILTTMHEEALWEILLTKTPKMLGLDNYLWTRESIGQAAETAVGAQLPTRTVSNYLRRWGMTLPQPAMKLNTKLPAHFRDWMTTGYPEFAARMKEEGAEIYWFTDNLVEKAASNMSGDLRMLAAVNNRGKVGFLLVEGTMTARILVKFMSRLCRDAERRVCLIACLPPPRQGKILRTWLERHRKKIRLFYLPTSPIQAKTNGR